MPALVLFLALQPVTLRSQDRIKLLNGDDIRCRIVRIDSQKIYFNYFRNDRNVMTFAEKSSVASYRFGRHSDTAAVYSAVNEPFNSPMNDGASKDTVKQKRWINMFIFDYKFGINAKGWSLQYSGCKIPQKGKFIFPVTFGIEKLTLDQDLFKDTYYMAVKMNYIKAGLNPFMSLGKGAFLNLGIQLIAGNEKVQTAGYFSSTTTSKALFGFELSQNILFMPESKGGLMAGIGIFEKSLSSEVYSYDLGFQLFIGIKF